MMNDVTTENENAVGPNEATLGTDNVSSIPADELERMTGDIIAAIDRKSVV